MARKEALVGALVGDADTRFILAFNDGLGKLARLKDAPRRARLSAGGVLVKLKKGQSLQSVVAIATERELRLQAGKKRRAKPTAPPPKKPATRARRPAAARTPSARAKNKSRPGRSARAK
jgi:topoisomerase IA-like protein